jgi:hypothetical protein
MGLRVKGVNGGWRGLVVYEGRKDDDVFVDLFG